MLINQDIRSGNPEVDQYIESLEKFIESDKTFNITRLIVSCNEIAGTFADDILLLKDAGTDEEIDDKLNMLGSKKAKTYDKFLTLLGEIKHFKTIVDFNNSINGSLPAKEKKDPVEVKEAVVEKKKKMNIQDFVLNK